MRNRQPEKQKPKHSIHDYKPKKRYTREEREKIEAGRLLLELIRRGQAENDLGSDWKTANLSQAS